MAEVIRYVDTGSPSGTQDGTTDVITPQQNINDAEDSVDKGGTLVGIPITNHDLDTGDITTVLIAGTANFDGEWPLDSETTNEIVIDVAPDTHDTLTGGTPETFSSTDTVDNQNRAYSTLSQWESTEQADISAGGSASQMTVICRASPTAAGAAPVVDSAPVVITGWTTDATNYIKITTDSISAHVGEFPAGNRYSLRVTDDHGIDIQEDYVRIEGIGIQTTLASTDSKYGVNVSTVGASNDIRIERCIIKGVLSGTTDTAAGINIGDADAIVSIYNNLIYDYFTTGDTNTGIHSTNATTVNIYNNTIENCNQGIKRTLGTVTSTNNAVFNCDDDHNGTVGITYCATDDTESGTGNVVVSDWDTVYSNITHEWYYLLPDDTDLIGNGSDLSGSFTTDIRGKTRSSWDIGCMEYTAEDGDGTIYVDGVYATIPSTSGPEYYVNGTTGDDSNGGLSAGDAWATIGKATVWGGPPSSSERFKDGLGGIIYIAPGLYRERISLPLGSSNDWTDGGSDANRIIITGDGTGEVIIDSGCTADEWFSVVDSGNEHLYKSVISEFVEDGGNPGAGELQTFVIDDDMYSYHQQETYADVDTEGDFYYDAAGSFGDSEVNTVYLYPLAGKGDPTNDDVVIMHRDNESNTEYTLGVPSQAATPTRYVTIQNLTIRGSKSHGVQVGTGKALAQIIIQNCKITANAKSGINSWLTNNCTIRYNYIYHNILRNWPHGMWNLTCHNISAGGWPQACGGPENSQQTIRGNIVSSNNGEGIGGGKGVGTHICYDNVVKNNWSMGIYFDNNPNNIIRNNHVYVDREFTSADVGWHCADGQGSCAANSCINSVLSRSRQIGISLGDEDYGHGAKANNCWIYNNIVANCRKGIQHYKEATGAGAQNFRIFNNTIIVPNADPAGRGGSFEGIALSQTTNDINTYVYNNAVYAQHADNYAGTQEIDSANTGGMTWDYNIWYHTTDESDAFEYDSVECDDFDDWKFDSGEDANSTYADPDLTDISDISDASGFIPVDGSVSTSGGTGVPVPTDYLYESRPQGGAWSRGAYENDADEVIVVVPDSGAGGGGKRSRRRGRRNARHG